MTGKWDEQAIDSAYEELLDATGSLLDRMRLSGFDVLLGERVYWKLFFELVEKLERELLIQWKTKKERGLERLFMRQGYWYRQEMRKLRGVFSIWNELYFEIQGRWERHSRKMDGDPWQTILVKDLTDFELFSKMIGKEAMRLPVLEKLCAMFQLLIQSNPYRLFIGFLNAVEIGIGFRPDILPLQCASSLRESAILEEVSLKLPNDLSSAKSWDQLPDILLKLWKE